MISGPQIEPILTDDQLRRLVALAQEISRTNGIPVSINMSWDYVSVNFSPRVPPEDEPDEDKEE